MEKDLNKLKIWVSFLKFFLGTVVVTVLGILIDASFTNRELEMKEMDQVGKYLNVALSKDIGVRKRFSEYFATTLRSTEARTRWKAYDSIMTIYYNDEVHTRDSLVVLDLDKEKEKENLEVKLKTLLNPKEKEIVKKEIEQLANQIHDIQERKIKVEQKLEVPRNLIEQSVSPFISGEKDRLSMLIVKFLTQRSNYCYSPEGIRNIGGKRKMFPELRDYTEHQIEAKLELLFTEGIVTHNCKDRRSYIISSEPKKIKDYLKAKINH
jgi:hypothetical protein